MYSYEYPRAALTVDSIIYVKEQEKTFILLIKRGREPFKNKWALPGGFLDMDETLEHACIRELKEETGLKVKKMAQFRAYDAIGRDPRHRTISVVFSAELEERQQVTGCDDAAQAKWVTTEELPELAFDHDEILNDFLKDNTYTNLNSK